jgi:hypothetical protein
MKKILILAACALGLCFAPSADAGYRRTIMGYDSHGNPIIRVTWEADHTNPYAYANRRTYATSGRRDPATIFFPPTMYYPYYTPVYPRTYTVPYTYPESVNPSAIEE